MKHEHCSSKFKLNQSTYYYKFLISNPRKIFIVFARLKTYLGSFEVEIAIALFYQKRLCFIAKFDII